ncbi:MAG: sodium-dependent transporter [Halobacteriovoraceae bacterium]|nr:sodium-dependent transporter [Halobacteriovoraceae bacterium]MCB9095231.1 sodium-dependent transporter [Halobacteriovoraceae bacterium]
MNDSNQNRGQWSSSVGFIIACVGSAVGLGNIWKFPYITYENGGGAFFIIYLIAITLVGFPIIISEMVLGRHAKLNTYGTFKELSNNNWFWKLVGLLCIFSAVTILSFYSVVAGWTLDYFFNSLVGNFQSLTFENAGPRFGEFVGNGEKQVLYHTIFMFLTAFIIYRGTKGIEKAVKILMPVLGILVFLIACISFYTYGASDTISFMFNFDFSKITSHGVLEAVGHAFFTLSLGLGVMIVYGSYLPKGFSLVRAGIWITIMDTLIATFSCFMMYPIIFGTQMEVKESAAILFTTLSVQFNALPMGNVIAALFYLLVAFAALSSTISLLEPLVSFIDETYKINRKIGTIIGAVGVWIMGIASALGNGASEFFTSLALMDKLDYFTSNWSLPVGGMLISLFAGFFVSEKAKRDEFTETENKVFFKAWNFTIRFISPLLVLLVILYKIGVF